MTDEDAAEYTWEYASLLPSDEPWVRVDGGRLGQPIMVRFGRQGPRFFVAALHVENGQEIKGSDLRFPLAAIAEQIAREAVNGPSQPDYTGVRKMKEFSIAREDWAFERMHEQDMLDSVTPVTAPDKPRGRGATPPSEEELRSFARAYVEELANRPRGAVSRAAERFHMHRVTGYKWLARCRELGLLPSSEELS